jgi:arylsulfatase A-like enzyme/Tfp pilus assembly protein PilF
MVMRLLPALIAASVLIGCGGDIDRQPGAADDPGHSSSLNLLLITLDTTRADRLGCYGYEPGSTANIDALARQGVLFEQAFSPVTLTVTSHATIFTGNFPPYHGVRTNDEQLLDQPNLCLAEHLRDQGYRTAAFIGAEVMERRCGLDQGFDEYWDDFSGSGQARGVAYPEKRAEEVIREAVSWLEGPAPQPFFLWVHLFDPHRPYLAPTGPEGGAPVDPYDAEISYSDHWIGELIAVLDQLDLRQRTLVAFLSDHGEGLGEHQERAHGIFIYDSTLQVPLILSCPAVLPQGERIAAQVRTVDLLPTVLELLALPQPEKVHGVSLVPLIRGESQPPLELYAESYYPNLVFGWSPLLGIRTAEWKAIHAPRPELYHLGDDSGETDNRYQQDPERAKDLLSRLERWTQSLQREGVSASRELDDKSREMLRSLGYFTGSAVDSTTGETASLADPKDRIEVVTDLQRAAEMIHHGRQDQAVSLLESLLTQEPESAKIYTLLGEALVRSKEYPRAKQAYLELSRLDPQDAGPLVNLGSIAMLEKEFTAAAGYFERALAIDPRSSQALLSLGFLHYKALNDPERARYYFARFLEEAPAHSQAPRVRKLLARI